MKNGSLRIERDGGEVALRPALADHFTASAFGLLLEFSRNIDGMVDGFTLDAGRVRRLAFLRTGR